MELTPGTQLELQQENPYLQIGDQITGDYSLPFEVRSTPTNMRLLGFPGLLNTRVDNSGLDVGLYDGGLQHSTGKVKVEKAGINLNSMQKGGLSLYYLTGTSSFLQDIKDVQMQEIDYGGERAYNWEGYSLSGAGFWAHINRVLNGTVAADYAFFPVFNPKWDDVGRTHMMNLIAPSGSNMVFSDYGTTPNGPNAIVPFPYLKYVLKQAFAHVGWNVVSDLFADPDFNKIVLVNFRAIEWCWLKKHSSFWEIKPYDIAQFNLNECLPAMTMAEFIVGLKNRMGLWYDFDKRSKTVTIRKMKDVITTSIKDFTAKASPVMTKTVRQEKKVYALRNQAIGEYANGQPTLKAVQYQGKLASRDDLPPASESIYGHTYLCIRENNYYIIRQNEDTQVFEWQLYAYNVFDYEPAGANEDISTNCTTIGNDSYDAYLNYVPHIEFQGLWPNFGDAEGDWNTILLFNHGKVQTPGGQWTSFGSAGVYDLLGNRISQWSLAFEHPTFDGGDAGLVEIYWKQTLQIFNGNEEVEVTLYLDKAEYLNLQFSDLISIRNVRLYPKQIKSVLPYRGVLTVTGVRI